MLQMLVVTSNRTVTSLPVVLRKAANLSAGAMMVSLATGTSASRMSSAVTSSTTAESLPTVSSIPPKAVTDANAMSRG